MTDDELLWDAWNNGVSPCLPVKFTFGPEDAELEKKIRSIALDFNPNTGAYLLPPSYQPINDSVRTYVPYLDSWIVG